MNSSEYRVGGRLWARLAVVGLVSLLLVPPLRAQNVYESVRHASDERTVEINTQFPRGRGCGRQFSIADTVDVAVSGWVDASSALVDAPAGFPEHVLGAIRSRLHLPAVMSVGVFAPDSLGVAAATGAVAFTLDASGRVRNVHMVSKATVPTFDDVLPDAVKYAASDHRYPKFPPGYSADSVPFVVTFSTVLWGSGSAADMMGATAPADMFAVTLERYRDIHPASALQLPTGLSLYMPPTAVTPVAPPPATATPAAPQADGAQPAAPPARASGTPTADASGITPVWAEFVAGADGRVVPGTVRVLGSEPAATVTQVQTLLMQATITPATIATCSVPQVIRVALVVGSTK